MVKVNLLINKICFEKKIEIWNEQSLLAQLKYENQMSPEKSNSNMGQGNKCRNKWSPQLNWEEPSVCQDTQKNKWILYSMTLHQIL